MLFPIFERVRRGDEELEEDEEDAVEEDEDRMLGRHNPGAGGRQTPIAQRRPLQRIVLNAAALSPTKRRKQSHAEDGLLAEAVKPAACRGVADGAPRPPSWPEKPQLELLHEVLARLPVRDIVPRAAAVSRVWREVVHSPELWALLRPHVRLVDQFLVVERVVERRSKGHWFRCRRLGGGEMGMVRMVDLELTNAGKDDGVPTSFLREAAMLSKLRHPNVVRHLGAEILGRKAIMCTEFVHESFAAWYKRLQILPCSERAADIRGKFRQLLEGLSYVHHHGVMHRNLKPDNVFIDASGVVKIGDFTTTRMLDVPLQAYTPEDPKERDRSQREMRRLWYRAPELILRDEIYGPKVDAWSVGCLLAEAATGRTLFQSDSEIDHLFRVFRLLGTPTAASWPEVVAMKNFSPKFPVFSGFNLAQVARAACYGKTADQDALIMQAQPDRSEVLQNLLGVAAVLGPNGMLALDRLVTVPPSARNSADDVLQSPFFTCGGGGGGAPPHLKTLHWLHGVEHASSQTATESGSAAPVSEVDCPPISRLSSMVTPRIVWSILQAMKEQERQRRGFGGGGGDDVEASTGAGSVAVGSTAAAFAALPRLPPGFDPSHRAVMVDFLVGLSSQLSLNDYTLHLAVGALDRYMALQEEPVVARWQVVAATCLKVADVFAEPSKEYYKQENAIEYTEATFGAAGSPEQMLSCEKDVLPKLGFDLHIPTMQWFLQCFLAYGGFSPTGSVARIAAFISDLGLLDYDILAYAPSMRAQCALVLAVFFQQQVQAEKRQLPSRHEASFALPHIQHWDEHVRDRVCRGNVAVDAAMALQAMTRTLVARRREWKSASLTAVEAKHSDVARILAYPERFPTSKLVRYILPDCQRGLIPE